jgi:hypothetical protein
LNVSIASAIERSAKALAERDMLTTRLAIAGAGLLASLSCVAQPRSRFLDTPAIARLICDATPVEDRLPEVIAPMAGRSPVWLVEGDFGRWAGPNRWSKSAWILSRTGTGALQVRGRRLDASGTVSFRRNMDERPGDVLTIPDPWGRRWSMIPGGATAQLMKDYAFIGSMLMYPSPGCWELTATVGDDEVRIVRNLTKEP